MSATLAGAPASVRAAPAGSSLLEQAENAKQRGDHGAAAQKYDAYYRALGPEVRGSESGQYIVTFAATSYRAAFDATQDKVQLELSQTLIRSFLADVKAATGETGQPWAAELGHELAELDALLGEEPTPEPVPAATPDEPDPVEREPIEPVVDPGDDGTTGPPIVPPAKEQDAAAPPKRDSLGLGLLVGGLVGLGGGVGGLVYGSQLEARARTLEREENNDGDSEFTEAGYVDREAKKGNIWMGVGGAVAAIGLGAVIWGAVRIAQRRKKPGASASVGLLPGAGAGAGGGTFIVRGRF